MAEDIPTREVGDKKLSVALWITSHRLFMKKVLIGALIVISFVFYAITFYGLLQAFVIQKNADTLAFKQLTSNYIDFSSLKPIQSPQELEYSAIQVIQSAGGKKDVAMRVFNPNDNFFVYEIPYQFTLNDTVIYEGSTYIYPSEEKYLTGFGLDIPNTAGLRLQIGQIRWKRVDDAFMQKASQARNFTITNLSLERPSESTDYQTHFTITNESIFSYWNVDIFLIERSGDRVRHVNYTSVDQLDPLESREVMVNWRMGLSSSAFVEVFADVNILDEENFMEYDAGAGELK